MCCSHNYSLIEQINAMYVQKYPFYVHECTVLVIVVPDRVGM